MVVEKECGKVLRDAFGVDIEGIHTNGDGEDVYGECCDERNQICDECDMPISEHDQQFDNSVCQGCLAKAVK